ncbi:MAG: leucine-rich repeat protein [Bacteroides sp.]|nr:leucine-rich repeat protein [Bacteroides sp.]
MKLFGSLTHIFTLLSAIVLLYGCSNADTPTSLEPSMEIMDATEITRTSAKISVRLENPGSATLSYLRFCYGTADKIDMVTGNLDTDRALISYELTNLIPGTTYQYYAEAGTSSAYLRTETTYFSTLPNEKPRVSKVEILSSGPTGVVVEFAIEDDGGENILEAGCNVMETGDTQSRRFVLPKDQLSQGTHHLYITGLKLNTQYHITPFATNRSGESTGETTSYTTASGIFLQEAGILSSLFGNEPVLMKSLTISGNLNGDDFRFLRLLVGAPLLSGENALRSDVEALDLTDANIVSGGGTYDGSRYTESAVATPGLFADCTRLKNITLPNSLIAIQRDAFARSSQLSDLSIPMNVYELSPSADCVNLSTIDVAKANPYFSSIDGVLFNKDATEILWFPLGKTGHYSLPSSITTIGERAFAGTHITSLSIPESVTDIRRGAFAGSALEEIELPDNITNISEGMFQDCSSLQCVKLGNGVEFIGNYVFDGTTLTSLYIGATLPPYASADAFVNNSYALLENCTLYVPKGCRAIYRNNMQWKQFKRIVEY